MDLEKLIKEILIDPKIKDYLKEAIADKLSEYVKDSYYGEFKDEICKALKTEYEKLAKEFLTEYIKEYSIKRVIKDEFGKFTKIEIIDLLKTNK
mgnify:CR=1 FL=1